MSSFQLNNERKVYYIIFIVLLVVLIGIFIIFLSKSDDSEESSSMKRYCLALDLKDDPKLIPEYENYHKSVWPEIIKSIKDSGIEHMEIYRIMNRLFMIMEVNDNFSFEQKSKADASNPKVEEWEKLMWKYQEALPIAKPGEKWMLMEKIFSLDEQKKE